MTYNADLDPESTARRVADANTEMWDFSCPQWRDLSVGEDARFVDESDVLNADDTIVFTRVYRDLSTALTVIPGAND